MLKRNLLAFSQHEARIEAFISSSPSAFVCVIAKFFRAALAEMICGSYNYRQRQQKEIAG
jgi:hypothetical protein